MLQNQTIDTKIEAIRKSNTTSATQKKICGTNWCNFFILSFKFKKCFKLLIKVSYAAEI